MNTFIAALVLGLSLAVVGQGAAYDFSATELQTEAAGRYQREQRQQQAQSERDRAAIQSGDNSRLHDSVPQFDPRAFDGPGASSRGDFEPWSLNLPQNGGRSLVCRRGAYNAVHCF